MAVSLLLIQTACNVQQIQYIRMREEKSLLLLDPSRDADSDSLSVSNIYTAKKIKRSQVFRVSHKFIITTIYNHLRKRYHFLSVWIFPILIGLRWFCLKCSLINTRVRDVRIPLFNFLWISKRFILWNIAE